MSLRESMTHKTTAFVHTTCLSNSIAAGYFSLVFTAFGWNGPGWWSFERPAGLTGITFPSLLAPQNVFKCSCVSGPSEHVRQHTPQMQSNIHKTHGRGLFIEILHWSW